MRNSFLLTLPLVLGACVSLAWTPAAQATVVTVNVEACTPGSGSDRCVASQTYADPGTGITFRGWEFSGSSTNTLAQAANLTYKDTDSNETGLGVECLASGPTGGKCSQYEINATPLQYISASLPTAFSSLSIGVASVDSDGGDHSPETAYILGATCAQFNSTCTEAGFLGHFTFGDGGSNVTAILELTSAQLAGYSYLYVTPIGPEEGDAPDANILLKSYSYTVAVPEPAVLGMFGLGLLFLGGLVGLRRRNEQN